MVTFELVSLIWLGTRPRFFSILKQSCANPGPRIPCGRT